MDCLGWGCQQNLEGEWLHERGDWIPEGLCSREGKVIDGFVLVISIIRWNQMHIGSPPWNNEPITINWEDKWRGIIALAIGWKFDFAVDCRLPGKEVNPDITLRMEVWASRFSYYGYKHRILLLDGWENVHMCICGYWKYHNELCYKDPVCGKLSWCHEVLILSRSFIVNIAMSNVIKLHGQSVLFSTVMLDRCHRTPRTVFPQGGGFCNSLGENSM